MASPRIIISAAHHVGTGPDRDPGARWVDATTGRVWEEADWSRLVCARVVDRLAAAGATVTLIEQPLGATIKAINTVYADAALCIEPHLNAPTPASPARDYGAVLVSAHAPPTSPARRFARRFADELRAARAGLTWPGRVECWEAPSDAIPRTLGFLAQTRPPAVITESAFLGAHGGALWRDEVLERIAMAHVRAARAALGEAS